MSTQGEQIAVAFIAYVLVCILRPPSILSTFVVAAVAGPLLINIILTLHAYYYKVQQMAQLIILSSSFCD